MVTRAPIYMFATNGDRFQLIASTNYDIDVRRDICAIHRANRIYSTYVPASGSRDAKYWRKLYVERVSSVPSDSYLFIHCGVCEERSQTRAGRFAGKLGR